MNGNYSKTTDYFSENLNLDLLLLNCIHFTCGFILGSFYLTSFETTFRYFFYLVFHLDRRDIFLGSYCFVTPCGTELNLLAAFADCTCIFLYIYLYYLYIYFSWFHSGYRALIYYYGDLWGSYGLRGISSSTLPDLTD